MVESCVFCIFPKVTLKLPPKFVTRESLFLPLYVVCYLLPKLVYLICSLGQHIYLSSLLSSEGYLNLYFVWLWKSWWRKLFSDWKLDRVCSSRDCPSRKIGRQTKNDELQFTSQKLIDFRSWKKECLSNLRNMNLEACITVTIWGS